MDLNCRFCLKSFNIDEVYYVITEEIKESFEQLTQTSLIEFSDLENFICELCFTSLKQCNLFKNQLIENQNKLYAVDQCQAVDDSLLEKVFMDEEVYYVEPGIEVYENFEILDEAFVDSNNFESPGTSSSTDIKKSKKKDNKQTIQRKSIQKSKNKVPKQQKIPMSEAFTRIFPTVQQMCEICGEKFELRSQLLVHNIRIHKTNKTLKCDYCEEVFHKDESLKRHVNNYHIKERLHLCSLCPKTYIYKKDLKRHFDTVHETTEYQCELCNEKFSKKADFINHASKEHPGSNVGAHVIKEKPLNLEI